ncbi:MAG: DRTGG domain-containing protein [Peptococcaceae bacterium]|nr:DRTGG domain-containing protein [Peptococcaceae bacterium]
MSQTKHQQILKFIEDLAIGSKVSVRFIAKALEVSEGTAYRAIKEAEAKGFVRSIPKVGTIRIEGTKERQIEDLSLSEVAQIVEGIVICGQQHLQVQPTKFIIGAMELDAMERYLEKGCLFIVGNRIDAQLLALSRGASLLITGGLEPNPNVVAQAKELDLVILQAPYDTFAVTSMINRAIYDRLIAKELVLVEDIMVTDVNFLCDTACISDWQKLSAETEHSRFPVVNAEHKVVGMVNALDVASKDATTPIVEVMNAKPFMVGKEDAVSHVARVMLWEGWEVAVVVEDGSLIGMLGLQDLLEAFQQVQKQPQFGETVDNLILSGFRYVEDDAADTAIEGEITQFMTSEFNSASPGVLVTVLNMAAYIAMRKQHRLDAITENFVLYQFEPVPIGTTIRVVARIVSVSKKNCHVDLEMTDGDKIVAKAMFTSRMS